MKKVFLLITMAIFLGGCSIEKKTAEDNKVETPPVELTPAPIRAVEDEIDQELLKLEKELQQLQDQDFDSADLNGIE